MKYKILFLTLIMSVSALAQTKGTVSGTITDKEMNNAPLPFANVILKGADISTTTDENGKYSMSVNPGTYTIQLSFVGYESAEQNITVAAGETVTVNKALGSGGYTLKDVVVQATANREKETALLLEQKNAVEIKQSIGAQEMSRKGVSDVEEGLTKITGITKVGSRGLFVRGLEDRYNNLLINDLAAPTNNPFKKIIPLDLFPTDIVGVIEVYKTFNPNIYGDFAGGTFNIQTSKVNKSITKISLGAGFTTGNNLEDFLIADDDANTTKGFFGFNGKDRQLPGLLGSSPATHTFTPQESLKSFKSGFNAHEMKSPLNSSIGFLHAEKFNLESGNKFSYLLSLNFDNAYTFRKGVNRTVSPTGTTGTGSPAFQFATDFTNSEYRYKTANTSLLALNYSTERLQLNFNTLYILTTENTIQDQFGSPRPGLNNRLIRTNQLDKSNYLNGQLLGDYALTANKNQSIKAGVSFAMTKYDQPDRKSFEAAMTDANAEDATINYNQFLRQYLTIDGNYFVSGMAEYSLKFGKTDEKQNKLTVGFNSNVNNMESSYRFIAARSDSGGVTTNLNNIDPQINADLANNTFYFEENSGATYKVKLNEMTNAAYSNLMLKFADKWEINGGIRVEDNNRETKYRSQGSQTAPFHTRKYENLYVLPSLNIKYAASEKTNYRFAASKTYTRPVILESFPLTYLNADGTSIQGNPILKNSDNFNADLKWEVFPTSKEMFAVGVFGKYLKDPIERAAISNATTGTVLSYLNSDNATLYGLEAEFILDLGRIDKSLSDFSFGLNSSLMSTNVKVNDKIDTVDEDGNVTPNNVNPETFRERELQGASKFILNSDIKYQFNMTKTWSNTISLVYSVFSKRIYAVGTAHQDHIYELPFQQLDFVWGNKLSEHFSLKFSADNLLNPSRDLEFGNSGDYPINQNSFKADSYKKGVGFSLKLDYTF
ncbi:MAG TPA: TonB-dependent receptor [Flavobacterium sp.]|nr:TonB-dependent receptor [Flavobacterium sp.]